MSKYQFQTSNIYLPGSSIARNKLDLDEEQLIAEIETELLEQAYLTFLSELTPDTPFNEGYFISLHRRTFESLYEWAGVYRHEDMSKGGSLFCLGSHLPKSMKRFFADLAQEHYLSPYAPNRVQFAHRLAHYQCELIALHPFYELNGRITRLFFDLIAMANGYNPIDYSETLIQMPQNAYIQASIECVRYANTQRLEQIIFQGLTRQEST